VTADQSLLRILFWFRNDLRLEDNTGLAEAVRDARGDVVPFYTTEPEALSRPDLAAARVRFALESLAALGRAVERAGSHLALDHGPAVETVVRAARAAQADAVYWNEEYGRASRRRDAAVERALRGAGLRVRHFHDRLLVPPGAVATATGKPFVVFTPFRRACEALPLPGPLPRVTRLAPHGLPRRPPPTLERLGFSTDQEPWPGGAGEARKRMTRFVRSGLREYATRRDFPAAQATACISADLTLGTLSPRMVAAQVEAAAVEDRRLRDGARKFVSELRWRDFYAHVLHHFPRVETGAFRREYRDLVWEGDPAHFASWQAGRTGYPFVDAGMRELAATGFMHNRVRMVVASFLTKDLLLDWRLGERHFMRTLVDGDLASNNGGWQWAASTGTDTQPCFRIFNPVLQGRRFDPDGAYVRHWVPELSRLPARWMHRPWEAPASMLTEAQVTLGGDYPPPIVDHHEQRARAIAMYRRVRQR